MGTATAAAEGSAKSTTKTATKASGAGTKTKKTVRRKKPSSSTKSSASSNQATYTAARAAQMELAGQRTAAAARLADPLWYRIEDVLPATTEETAMAMPATKLLPEQVQIVEDALSNNNMSRSDVTPQAFCVLLEQARRYAMEIIADAQDYAVCASRNEITKADFDLASQMRPDHPTAVTTQLPKLNLLAQQINRIPLPPIPTQCYSGVLLPPKRHQLTARTFDVVSGAQVAQRMVQPKPSIATKRISSSSSKSTPKPSYGAARGRQISIQLKEKESEKKDAVTSSSAPTPAPASSAGAAAPTSSSGPAPMEISSPAAATPATSTAPAPAATPAPSISAGQTPAPPSEPGTATTSALAPTPSGTEPSNQS